MKKVFPILISATLFSCGLHSYWATLNYSTKFEENSVELNPVIEFEGLARIKINPSETEEVSDSSRCQGSWKALNFKVWPHNDLLFDIGNSKALEGASEVSLRYVKSFMNAKLIESGQIELVKIDSTIHEEVNWFQLAFATSINCNSSFSMKLVFQSTAGERSTRELFFYPHQYRKLDR